VTLLLFNFIFNLVGKVTIYLIFAFVSRFFRKKLPGKQIFAQANDGRNGKTRPAPGDFFGNTVPFRKQGLI